MGEGNCLVGKLFDEIKDFEPKLKKKENANEQCQEQKSKKRFKRRHLRKL